MHAQPLISDLVLSAATGLSAANSDTAALPDLSGDPLIESVVTAAVLVTCAFRLRDEAGLVAALRALTTAVDAMEARG
jgi:hypothetical protein